MYSKFKWLEIAQNLRSIAQAGLTYSKDRYDLERFEQIMEMSEKIIVDYSEMKMEKIHKLFEMEEGYLTPKVDVRAVVIIENQILLVKEIIDGKWALPGGWADVGLTASEVVEKEVMEEAGLEVKASRLLAVLDKKCHPHPPELYYVYKIFFLCEEVSGELGIGMETSEVRFFDINELPELSTGRNTKGQVEKMFEMAKNPSPSLFD